MRRFTEEQKMEVIRNYSHLGKVIKDEVIPHGHINDTILLELEKEGGGKLRLILQKINISVFRNPVGLMENVRKVTEYLKEKVKERGGDVNRETLNLVSTNDGENYCVDSEGQYWRAYIFVDGASTYNQAADPELFYQSGVAFGNFQRELDAFPAEELCETIPGFHDTVSRFAAFQDAVIKDVRKRAASVQREIEEVRKRESLASCYRSAYEAGKIPLRVTHNDTKLNNVMIDDVTGKGICVVDLDTVMPGFVMNDFGDAIRFGANTAAEDETDLSKVLFDCDRYEAFAKGFMESVGAALTEEEVELLPYGAMLMTYECGMRFLTDYLQGDVYFKTEYETHNLDRCRNQFKLLQEMEKRVEDMKKIVWKYR